MLSPILEKLTSTENDTAIKSGSGLDLDLVTIDTDVEQKLALEYKVRKAHANVLMGHSC